MTVGYLQFEQSTSDVLELLPIGALVIDRDLRIVEWNRTLADWTSIAKSEAIGTNLTTLFPNLSDNRYLERLTQVFLSGFPATYSAALHKHFLPVPARHGLDCPLMIQQTEVRLLSGSKDLALITIQDVSFQYIQLDQLKRERAALLHTQQRIAEVNQQLVEQNKELDDFTRMASHDLQEPLRKVTMFGELLESNLAGDLNDDARQYLFYMRDGATRMRSLIRDLLALSRAGRSEIHRDKVDLHELVLGVLALLDVAINEKGAQVHVDSLPVAECDERLIAQLFQNLIGNAIKFSDEDAPQIRVTCESQDTHWLLGVQDNGVGIDPAYQDRIFKPFVRLETRESYEGTGVGLSICKKAVKRHGGQIWVESTPGGGAHFKFTLPKPDRHVLA